MAATLPDAAGDGDLEALRRLAKEEPFEFLTADSELAQAARGASRHLFSALAPLCPKSPFDRLLVDGFDAEQIWQQIDLQTQHLVPGLRRRLNQFKRSPDGIAKLLKSKNDGNLKVGGEEIDEFEEEVSGDEEDEGEGRVGGVEEVKEMEDDEEEEEEEDEGEEEEGDGLRDVEDQFLKIKDQERYFEKREKEEFGEESGEDDADDEEDEEDEDDGEDNEDEFMDDIRYDDFFGSKERGLGEKKNKLLKVKDMDIDENTDDGDDNDDDDDDEDLDDQKEKVLSTHEKQLKKIRSKIEQMEKANLEPKTWTMQGEVTAAKRPKNSALEVDLDFEHNMRPAPVITEEVTASLEDLIRKRILEAHFDDVQKPPLLPSNVQRKLKELDENKSKKGLGEIYEEEYTQKAGLASAPLSYTDEQKKEANLLFKRLCLKLDALSHFHFAPKPVIEDMSIQLNLPALAMEEIAPLAVSDAAMLAPEEIFSGKGNIKEDGELTQVDRKRRRAKKKRKFKAEALKRSAAKQSQAKES